MPRTRKFTSVVKRHFNGLINYIVSCLTKSILSKCVNSKIQKMTRARGLSSRKYKRTRILIILGDFDLSFMLTY
jgi:hypothetical protein